MHLLRSVSRSRWLRVATAVALALIPSTLRAQQPPPRDWSDPFKHVRLSANGRFWVGFGGQVRERVESWTGFNFGAPPTADADDVFQLNRVLFSADFHFGERHRLFVQGKSSTVNDRSLAAGSTRPIDYDALNVQQAYGEARLSRVGSGTLTLRLGRQELSYGRERLVSTLDWANTRQTFEGYTGSWAYARGTLNAFFTRPVRIRRDSLGVRDSMTTFYGLYGTVRPAGTPVGVDAYWMGLNRRNASFNGTTGRETRQTLGARVWGPTRQGARLDYDIEGAYQLGTLGAGNVAAYMVAVQAGVNFPRFRGARVYAGVDYASGDDSAGGDVQTYNRLFGNPHGYLGFIDIIGRPNALDLSAGGTMKLWRELTGQLDVHTFRRASAGDVIYNKVGAVISGRTFTGRDTLSTSVGTEYDLTLRYPLGRHFVVSAGYSGFSPGRFIKQTGPGSGVSFGYTTLQLTL